jgi:hypothetical protein
LRCEQSGEAGGGAQFPRFRTLSASDLDRFAKRLSRLRCCVQVAKRRP